MTFLQVNPNLVGGLLSADTVQALGWTLIHFLWEGLALLALFLLLQATMRTARARYNLACATLTAMAAAPLLTFLALHADASPLRVAADITVVTVPQPLLDALDDSDMLASGASPWLNWLVAAWVAGVALLSVRVAGGWYVADSLRRRDVSALPAGLVKRCEQLRVQLAISRPVRFLQSTLVNAPAVVGWLRPVVLIPASAVMGLSAAQLEAVIVHELAHIRRFDALANLLQMMVETVLFYHPAVWWISRRIRMEREHCCDDVAVRLSGDALGYAKALASLEEWRSLPAPVLAANGGVLKQRISRLLGLNSRTNSMSGLGVAGIGFVCLAGCVVAHGADVDAATPASAFTGMTLISDAPAAPPAPPAPAAPLAAPAPLVPSPVPLALPALPAVPAQPALPAVPSLPPLPPVLSREERSRTRDATRDITRNVDRDDDSEREAARRAREMQRELANEQVDHVREQANQAREVARAAQDRANEVLERVRAARSSRYGQHPAPEDASYVAALESAGLRDLDAGAVLALKGQNVTADYVREMNASGAHVSVNQILALKSQGIGADFVKQLHDAGLDPSLSQVLALHSQKVTPAFVRDIRASWPDASASQIIALQSRAVTPDFVKSVRANWPDVSLNDLIALRSLNISAGDVGEFKKTGLKDVSVKDVFAYKAVGVTPDYVRALQKAGLDLAETSPRQITSFKTTGVTPDLVKALQGLGLTELSSRDYVTAQTRGLTPEFLEAVRKHNFKNLTMRQLMVFKDADVFG